MSSNSEQSSEDLVKNSVCKISLGHTASYYEIDPQVFQKIVNYCKEKNISFPTVRSGSDAGAIKKALDSWLEENPGNEKIWTFFHKETPEYLIEKAKLFKDEVDAEKEQALREIKASNLRILTMELESIRNRIKDYNSYIDATKKISRFSEDDMRKLAKLTEEYTECYESLVSTEKRFGIKARWDEPEKISSTGGSPLPLSNPNSITPIAPRFSASSSTHNDYVRSILLID